MQGLESIKLRSVATHVIHIYGKVLKEPYLVRTEVEVSELPPLQIVRHVRRLLLAGQCILPDVDTSAPAHG